MNMFEEYLERRDLFHELEQAKTILWNLDDCDLLTDDQRKLIKDMEWALNKLESEITEGNPKRHWTISRAMDGIK